MQEFDNITNSSVESSINPKFLAFKENYSSLEAEELIAAANEFFAAVTPPPVYGGRQGGGLESHLINNDNAPHPATSAGQALTSPRKQGEDYFSNQPSTINHQPTLFSFSSFGSWSALLLHMIAEIDKSIPVLFLDTGKHFPETIKYANDITKHLGLKNLITLTPDDKILSHADIFGNLWQSNVNRCCWIRKVEPLDRFIDENTNLEAIITGRRAYQTKERQQMEKIELDDKGKIRINPLAFWSKDKIKEEFKRRNLFNHPLVEQGYPSIGCAPCTRQVMPGEDERAGRWAHIIDMSKDGDITAQKQECGIHLSKSEVSDWVI
ncbi:MAG: phosphoadenylyl-sulfate reductase [Rickettsiales bacterium]|nr:phosphoadenylyl-sulfate reductase [Rickettsiales bacterium]